MSAKSLLNLLEQVQSKISQESLAECVLGLRGLCTSKNEKELNALNELVLESNSPALKSALDACLDVLLAHSGDGAPGRVGLGWDCYTLGMLVQRPVGATYQDWSDAVKLMKPLLCEDLGVLPDDVHLDHQAIAAEEAYTWTPLQAFDHVRLVRERAQSGTFSFLRSLHPNKNLTDSKEVEFVEMVLTVAVREDCVPDNFHDKLFSLDSQPPLHWNIGNDIEAQVLWGAAPWSGLTTHLHDFQSAKLGVVLEQLSVDKNVPLCDMQLFAVMVKPVEGPVEVRVAITEKGGKVLGGVAEKGLAEPAVYMEKVAYILKWSDAGPLSLDPQIYQPASSEPGPPLFKTPKLGWFAMKSTGH